MVTNEGLRPSITIEQMVQREVLCCMSSLVSTLATGYGAPGFGAKEVRDLSDLMEQASELGAPVLDYEEAAAQAGWESYKDRFGTECWRKIDDGEQLTWAGNAQDLYENHGIDPYEWEVYEHWAVSIWLAEKLQAQGERVDTDFAGLNIWARTTTGQAISMDGCIQRIYADMMAPHTLDSVAPGA